MRRTLRNHLGLPLAVTVMAAVLAIASSGCSPMGGMHEMQGMQGMGEDTRSEQLVESPGDALVEIANFAFAPGNLQVTVGTSVSWTNRDSVSHTSTAVDVSWDTGLVAQGESVTVRFDAVGVYEYFCIPHPGMKARVEVVA